MKQVCHPKNFDITQEILNQVQIKKDNTNYHDIKKDIQILFKTISTDNSRYLFQKNATDYPDKVAVMAQFIPNFRQYVGTSDKVEFTTDPFDLIDNDSETDLNKKAKLGFIFIVDRSGSMHGIKMELVKEAL